MLKFAFPQYFFNEYLGTMYLCAGLKNAGHECRVFIGGEREVLHGLASYRPDVVAFSLFTAHHRWAVRLAGRIKAVLGTNTFVMAGGPHPTFYPEFIDNDGIDAVCLGEGDEAIVEFARAFEQGRQHLETRNFWFKTPGGTVRNALRPLVPDLDALPVADRDAYYEHPFLRDNPNKAFVAGRGCPFGCSFCFNRSFREMYRGLPGQYVRFRSPEKVIEEIAGVRARYPLPSLRFYDDVFVLDKNWLRRFLTMYRAEIGVPFYCNVRANLVDEETVALLKNAGCFRTSFGVESGSERIRNGTLKKGVTDEQIYRTAALLRKYRLEFDTTNMLGLPGETLAEAWQTIQMNIDIKAGAAWTSVFQPYPRTELADEVVRRNLVPALDTDGEFADAHSSSPLRQPDIREIVNLHKFAHLVTRFPFLKPLVRALIRWPPNALFTAVYKVSYFFLFYQKVRRLSGKRLVAEIRVALRY